MNEELKVIISAEIKKLKQGVETAKKNISNFKNQVKKASKDVDKDFKAMGTAIANGMKAAGVAIAGATVALLGMSAATQEYRNNQAKLITAFEAAGGSAKEATETYNGLYRVLGDDGQATEAAAHLAKLTTNQEHLSEWTRICQGAYATFGDSLPIEGLTEAANETAKTGVLTGGLADALNWAGISEEEFQKKLDKCNSEAEREALIRTTLNGVYGEAADLYEENNAAVLAQNDANRRLTEAMSNLGAKMTPVITAFTDFGAKALAVVAPYISDLVDNLLPVLQILLDNIAIGLETALGWMQEHSTLLGIIAIAIGAVVIAIGLYNAVSAIKAAMAAAEVTTVWGLVSAYAAHAVAVLAAIAPYLLIVAAIAAVIAIIVLCVKHWDKIKEAAAIAWEWIKEKWAEAGVWFAGVVEAIKKAFADIGAWFSNLFSNAWNGIKNAWSSVKTWFISIWNSIKQTFASVGTWFSGIFTGAWNGIKNAFSSVSSFFTGIWNSIKNIFGDIGGALADSIGGTVKSAINGILGTGAKIINGFISAINFAIDVINAIPGVSISRLSSLSVPQLAKGGIVDSATLAVVGEQGKEAVVPLENNLEWLDKLADRINAKNGSGTPIILQIDGKTFAQTTIDSINQLTRQTGNLALNLA
jgi:phage-related protein